MLSTRPPKDINTSKINTEKEARARAGALLSEKNIKYNPNEARKKK